MAEPSGGALLLFMDTPPSWENAISFDRMNNTLMVQKAKKKILFMAIGFGSKIICLSPGMLNQMTD
jgi:hypothetical protein